MDSNELENRLINFAVLIIEICDEMVNSKAGNHLAGQLIRSGTSPALNYGEAQSAESKKDFIHKIQVVLKELRETLVNIKICYKAKLYKNKKKIEIAGTECNELIAIFVKSSQTAKKSVKR